MALRSRFARIGLAGLLTLAGAGVAVAAAAPAEATVSNATVAVPAGTMVQDAIATCPAGEYLTGGGGAVVNGGGDVTLTDVIPDLGTNQVHVWAHANPGAAPGAYQVQAQAICLPGAPPANYQLVPAASGLNATTVKTVAVACPAGTSLLGLGSQLDGADGNVLYQAVQPNAAVDGGLVRAAATGGFASPWRLTAYAICGTRPAGVVASVVSTPGPNNSVTPKAQGSGACAAGATTGVGGTVSLGGLGNVMLSRYTALANQNGAQSGADEDGAFAPNWQLTAHNICWG